MLVAFCVVARATGTGKLYRRRVATMPLSRELVAAARAHKDVCSAPDPALALFQNLLAFTTKQVLDEVKAREHNIPPLCCLSLACAEPRRPVMADTDGEATLTATLFHPDNYFVVREALATFRRGQWTLECNLYVHCGRPTCRQSVRCVALGYRRDKQKLCAPMARPVLARVCDYCCKAQAPDAAANFLRCGRCRVPAYCSAACQRADWTPQRHRAVCRPCHQ